MIKVESKIYDVKKDVYILELSNNMIIEVFKTAQTVPDNIHGNKKSGIQKRMVETRQIFT